MKNIRPNLLQISCLVLIFVSARSEAVVLVIVSRVAGSTNGDNCFLSLANIIQTKPATIDINGFACDIASFVTGQKHDGVGDILYVAKPAKRGLVITPFSFFHHLH